MNADVGSRAPPRFAATPTSDVDLALTPVGDGDPGLDLEQAPLGVIHVRPHAGEAADRTGTD